VADAAVTQAIYAMGLDPAAYVQASQKVVQLNEQIVNSTEKVVVSEENVTKATTTRASSLDRITARYNEAFRIQQQYEKEVAVVNKAEADGVGSIQRRAAALQAANQNYEAAILRLNSRLKDTAGGIGLNRIGLMELQAAGINSFQALAAGMDPFRVATMEGAQVVGAFVQGGIVGFKALLGPLGVVAAAAAAAAIGWKLWGRALDDTSPSEQLAKENQKKIKEATDDASEAVKLYGELQKSVNEVLLTSAENTDRAAAAKRGETRALAENTLEVVKNRTARLTPDLMRAQGRVADLQSRPDAASSAVGRDLSAAQEEVARLQKALADLRQMADDANDALDRISNPNNWGKTVEATQKANESVEKYIRGLENAAQAAGQSAEQNKITAAILEAQERLIDSQGKKIRDLSGPERERIENAVRLKNELDEQSKIIQRQFQDDVRAEQSRLKKNDEVERDIEKMEELAQASGKSTEETKVQAAIIAEQNKLYDDQGHKIRDLTDAEKDRIRNSVELKDKNDKLQKDLEHAIKQGTDRATSYAADTLYDAFTGKITSVGDFLKKTLLRAAADVAAQMIFRPLIQPIMASAVGAVPGLFGISGGAPGVAGSSGGMSLLGTGSNLLSLGQGAGLFGGLGMGVTNAINSFGASIGFGGVEAAAPSAAFIGPMPATSGILGTTSLSQFLGGAGLGFAAGSLLNGLLGGNQAQGMVGSGVGALAGAAIGSIVPGIGTLIGGLLGGAGGGVLGGLFGPGDSVGPIGSANFNVANGALVRGPTAVDNGGDLGAITKAGDTLVQTLNALNTSLKLSLTGSGFLTSIGFGQAPGPHTSEEVVRAIYGSGRVSSGNSTLDSAITAYFNSGKTSGQSADQLTATLSDIVNTFNTINSIDLKPEQLTQTEQVLKAINDQFDALKTKAQDFGLSIDNLDAARQKAIADLTSGFNDSIQAQIDSFTNPFKQAMDALTKAQDSRLKEAEKAGADLVKVEQLSGLERERVLKQYNQNIQQFLDSITTGSGSPLSPTAILSGNAARYNALLAQAQAGNADARQAITGAAGDYLNAARTAFASSGQYFDIYNAVTAALRGLLAPDGTTPIDPGGLTLGDGTRLQGFATGTLSAPAGWAMVGERGPELVRFRGGEQVLPNGLRPADNDTGREQVRLLSGIYGEMAALRDTISAQNKTIAQLSSKLARIAQSAA
jgi:hypothetical protein